MNSRERAREYDAQRKAMQSVTGSTKTHFGDVGRNIDAESEKPKLIQQDFVEQPKSVEEHRANESKPIREETKKIENDQEKETDRSDFKKEPAKSTVRSAPANTVDSAIINRTVGGAFTKAWTISDHVLIPEVIEPKKSFFFPNFIAATIIIDAVEHCLDGVEELKWISPHYFSLPARIYWCVLFYIQILKAKEAAKKLSKVESTWFRAFKRIYPLEALPVIGPLVPFFSNVISVKPNDDMYDFIYPDYDIGLGLDIKKGHPAVLDSFYIQPNIYLMAEFLKRFTVLTRANLSEQIPNDGLRYFDDSGNFVPHRIGEAFTFAGINYPAVLTVGTSNTLSTLGLDKPLPESSARLLQIQNYWKRSKITDMPAGGTDQSFNDIGSSLKMVNDFEWFEDCVEMATVQCKFFSDSINMSQIPSTGGSEALISAHIYGKHERKPEVEAWFPRSWRSLRAEFRTTRADTTTEQIFNAGYALSTATISWTSNGHSIGGHQVGHRGGPYWANKQFQFELDTPVEVQRRTATMVRSLFFHAHGDAS
nr:MAG: putative capsid protein [Partitiviridae sp.]